MNKKKKQQKEEYMSHKSFKTNFKKKVEGSNNLILKEINMVWIEKPNPTKSLNLKRKLNKS